MWTVSLFQVILNALDIICYWVWLPQHLSIFKEFSTFEPLLEQSRAGGDDFHLALQEIIDSDFFILLLA